MGAGYSAPQASVVVAPASGDSGEIRRNPRFKDELVASAFPKDVTTLYEGFQRGLKLSRDAPCMGYRPITKKTVDGKEVVEAGDFVWSTYGEIQGRIDAIGSALLHFGMADANDLGHRLIGLFSKNRMEWVVAEQACHAYSMVDVPLYDTLGTEAMVYIINQTGMPTVFTDAVGTGKLVAAKKAAEPAMPTFKFIVQFETVSAEAREAAAAAGLTLRSFEEMLDAGKKNPAKHIPPKPEDLAFICYTSGTTGMPKGAMISHRNMVADASSAYTARLGLTTKDVHLSYLPLAHVFERLVESAMWMVGARVGFYQGDTLKLMADIAALRPTIFPSVPRLFNRIYDKIMGGVEEAGGSKARIFKKAFEAKRRGLLQNKLHHGLWDKIVFGKIAKRVGLDRCHIMLTGSAPIAAHVMEFLRIVFACHVCEGYGQTECSAAATLTDYDDQASKGHVGGPLACNDVKLVSVPDMGYLVTDTVHGQEVDAAGKVINPGIPCVGRGEVCYRGPNVFSGYYKDAEKTAEALDADGWLHSGDIGLWDSAGHLRIIDRKKAMFKLSQGEYVAAEKIENVYIKSSLVAQAFVYGDSLHSMVVGIIVPDAERLLGWAKKAGKGDMTVAALCKDGDVKRAITEDMAAMAKEARLQGFECVKDIFLEPTMWTPEDLLTPTFKLKRADAKKKYLPVVEEMYGKLEKVAGATGLKQGAV